MNVEKLYRVIADFDSDLKKISLTQLLTDLNQNLQYVIGNPGHAPYQSNLVISLETLYNELDKSEYNNYTPMYKETIKEITGDLLFGSDLKVEIEKIFTTNTITPAKAAEEIDSILQSIIQVQNGISNTISGLEILNIKKEELEPGECEIGYSIPRIFIDNKLEGLRNEISELNFILNFFNEAVKGKKEDYRVKTISSSDFLLYVIICLQVANVLSKAVERILNHYKQILEIKSLRNQLSQSGVPEKETKSIDDYANNIMQNEIKKIAKEIIDEHYKNGDTGRKNEVQNGLTIALNKLANRIDNGFNVEIRVKPLPASKIEEKSEKVLKDSELINSIMKTAKNIDYIEAKGKSILKLPEENDRK